MAPKPLTTEAVAFTEKKMDMKLDDIVHMSKNPKARKQRWFPNKSPKFSHSLAQDKYAKARHYTESRPFLRQGVLAKRRSTFLGNHFPVATEVARRTIAAPLRYGVSNRNKVASWNKTRSRVPASQRRAAGGGIAAKRPLPSLQQQEEDVNIMPKKRPKTLDSLFANMHRMRLLSRQNNTVQHNGGWNRRPPWRRGRFGN